MTFDAIVFDLDGTLIDSVHDVRVNLNLALEGMGRRALSLDETKDAIGYGGRVLVEKALELTGDAGSADMIDGCTRDFLDLYVRNPVRLTPVFPGVLDVLAQLKAEGVSLGICTNKPESTTGAVLDGLDLAGYFQAVTCGDTVPHRKPDGRHVLLTMEMMGADTAVMVGDSETDMAAGRNARLPVIAVAYGYRHCAAEDLDADILIESFSSLPEVLSRLRPPSKAAR
jgi:phosphoglycolate phosphatase